MKLFFGILSTIVVLVGATLTILALWGIQPISWVIFIKAVITIAVICAAFLLLWLVKTIFFKKETSPRAEGRSNNE